MAYKTWVGTGQPSADWSVASNWSPADTPRPGDIVSDNGGSQMVVTNPTISQQQIWLNNFRPSGRFGATNVSMALMNSSLGQGTSLVLNAQAGQTAVVLHNSQIYGQVLAVTGSNAMTIDATTYALNW